MLLLLMERGSGSAGKYNLIKREYGSRESAKKRPFLSAFQEFTTVVAGDRTLNSHIHYCLIHCKLGGEGQTRKNKEVA
jgi:hypothetical protein